MVVVTWYVVTINYTLFRLHHKTKQNKTTHHYFRDKRRCVMPVHIVEQSKYGLKTVAEIVSKNVIKEACRGFVEWVETVKNRIISLSIHWYHPATWSYFRCWLISIEFYVLCVIALPLICAILITCLLRSLKPHANSNTRLATSMPRTTFSICSSHILSK